MPLFGGKKEKSSGGNPGKASYPTQNAAAYPTQNYGNSGNPQGYADSAAPPPYSAVAPSYAAPYQPMSAPTNQVAGGPPMYSYHVAPQNVVVQGGFDAGARFDANTRATIPPPPPGTMLHPAQMAALQGSNVVVTQRKGDFWTGGSDGGYTLW